MIKTPSGWQKCALATARYMDMVLESGISTDTSIDWDEVLANNKDYMKWVCGMVSVS